VLRLAIIKTMIREDLTIVVYLVYFRVIIAVLTANWLTFLSYCPATLQFL